MITKDELLQGRDKTFADEYTEQISDNLDALLEALNAVRTKYGKPMIVSSAWRPASMNGLVKGAAPKSNHIIGLACDFRDTDGELRKWCLENLQVLKDLGIFLEDFRWTPNWTHMQIVKPKSGKRIFIPSAARAENPDIWDGKYDSKFDEKPVK